MAGIFSDASRLNNRFSATGVARTSNLMVENMQRARADRAAAILQQARQSGATPEAMTRLNELRSTTSLPPSFDGSDPAQLDTLEARVAAQRERNALQNSPRTASYFSEYANAVEAQDGVEEMSTFENAANAFLRSLDRVGDDIIGPGNELRLFGEQYEDVTNTRKSLQELIAERRRIAETKWNEREVSEGSRGREQMTSAGEAGAPSGGSAGRRATRGGAEPSGQEASSGSGGRRPDPLAPDPEELPLANKVWANVQGFRDFYSTLKYRWRSDEALDTMTKDLENVLQESVGEYVFEAEERNIEWPMADWAREIAQDIQQRPGENLGQGFANIAKVAKEKPGKFAAYMAGVTAESGASLGAALTVGAVTRNPALFAATMGAGSNVLGRSMKTEQLMTEYGYDLTTPEGRAAFVKDPSVLADINDRAKAYGIVIGLMDGMSGGVASKTLVDNPVGNMVAQLVVQAVMGGGGEALATLAAKEDIDWNEVVLEGIAELVTAPFEVGGATLSGAKRKVQQHRTEREQRKFFEIVSGMADTSKLKARDKKTYAKVIDHVTRDGPVENVHVDPETFSELFQSGEAGVSIEEFFDAIPQLDIREFEEAMNSGTLYRIPTSLYATEIAGTDMDAVLRPHVKFAPDAMSRAEAEQFEQDIVETQRTLSEDTEALQTVIGELEGPLAEEMDRLRSEIVSAQGITLADAEKQASLLVASARTGAARSGLTVADYLRRYTLPAVRNADTVTRGSEYVDPNAMTELVNSGADAAEYPDLAAIRDRLEENGVAEGMASIGQVEDAVKSLIGEGAITGTLEDGTVVLRANPEPSSQGEEMMQTATIRSGEEDASEWGIDTSKKNKVRDIALALQKRQRARYGKINRKQRGPKTVAKMAEWMADEIEFELQTPNATAQGWYTTKYQAALDELSSMFPELSTGKSDLPGLRMVTAPEDARVIFTAILAVTSNGAKVTENFDMAVATYAKFRETGELEAPSGGGGRAKHTRSAFKRLTDVIQEQGSIEAVNAFLLEEITVREANQQLAEAGMPKISGLPADMIVPRSATILGPKLGAFYANLSGSTGYLTMDLWWTRTINRYRGDVLPKVRGLKNEVDSKGNPVGLHRFKVLIDRPDLTDKAALNIVTEYAQRYADKGWKNGSEAEKAANTLYKDAFVKLAEKPEGAADRRFMVEVAEAARQNVMERTGEYFSLADIQALIWYYEKRLYADMGVGGFQGDISYQEAASRAMQNALKRDARDQTFEQVDPASSNFKRWFGDSKVVDENGEPLVVYHGTNAGGFNVFDTEGRGKTEGAGAFFTDSAFMASTYFSGPRNQRVEPLDFDAVAADPEGYGFEIIQDDDGDWEVYSPTGEFYPDASREAALEAAIEEWVYSTNNAGGDQSGAYEVYLSLRDPMIVDAKGANWDRIGGEEFFVEDVDGEVVEYASSLDAAEDFVSLNEEDLGPLSIVEGSGGEGAMSTDDLARMARDAGADGLIIQNVFDEGPNSQGGELGTVYAVFDPAQIKSVNNRGTFDPADPNIMYQTPMVTPPVDQLPDLEKASPGRVAGVREVATRYMQRAGLPVRHQAEYAKVDKERAAKIAQLYDEMEDNPNDPEVKAAYEALAEETIAQYEALQELGFTFTWIVGEDPYDTPADAVRDMQENKHLAVFPTDDGFGTLSEASEDNPLLAMTSYVVDGRRARVNDLFRIVHDVFGHGSEGASFGPRGEENAWQAHVRMFSPLAARAMTTETRGQNSWVNYGPYGEQNRANPAETIFADQKVGLLPEWVTTEGQVPDVEMETVRLDTDPAVLGDFDPSTLRDMTPEEQLKVFQRPGWFAISAVRDADGESNSPANRANMDELRALLNEMGLEYYEVEGRYDGGSEPSLLVLGDEKIGHQLGRDFHQESVLTKDGLVYTDGRKDDPVPFGGVIYGFDAKREDFYSVFKDGLPIDAFSLELEFPEPVDVTVDDGDGTSHYGARVVNGTMRLTHWSREQLDTIDPAKAGTGPLRGPERKRSGPRKTFFGLHIGMKGGYRRESYSLGDFRHEVEVDPRTMYPYDRDPDGLRDTLDMSKTSIQRTGDYEQAIKDAGYAGFFVVGPDAPLGDAAVLFDAVEPTRVVVDNGARSLRSTEFNEWFGESQVVNEDGSPEMVYHATIHDFPAFRPFSHFGTTAAAKDRYNSLVHMGRAGPREPARTIPGYLSLQKPLHLGVEQGWSDTFEMMSQVSETLGDHTPSEMWSDEVIYTAKFEVPIEGEGMTQIERSYTAANIDNDFVARRDEPMSMEVPTDQQEAALEAMRKQAAEIAEYIEMKHGYDGLIYTNQIEDPGSESYITFHASQFKTAFNRGNWDINTDDYLFQSSIGTGANGSIILPTDFSEQAVINLFETANLTTMLHETGHFFLYQMQKQAADGLEFAANDMKVVTDWWKQNAKAVAEEASSYAGGPISASQVEEYLTVGSTSVESTDRAIHRALHEQFARGFEAYALEGKSPSNALRSIFESFAAWLLSWYKSAKTLNVDINDDIRGVFDRILAVDEEMTSAEARNEINDEVARTAREMGLDEDSYRRLVDLSAEARDEGRQLARKELLQAEAKMRRKEYRARYAEIEEEERARVQSQPVHRAIQWLAYGRWLGEDRPQDLPLDLRMDTEMLVDEYGQEIVDKLPRGRRPVHVKDSLMQADEVAGWFGFDSGADLLEAMIQAPKANEAIKQATEARARSELGDPMVDPDSVAQATDDALHGEKRGQLIVAEMRAMNRVSGGRSGKTTTRAQARAIAQDLIQRMPVREALQTSRYLAAERKHAEDSARALAAGDVKRAFELKRKQLIQHSLYTESRKAAELVRKAENLAGRLKRKGTRQNLAGEYLGAIDDILETYDFRKMTGKAENRRLRLQAYLDMMKAEGRENELAVPDHVRNEARRIPYKQLSVRRLQGVYDTLKNIEHTARRREKLRVAQQERDRQEVRDEIAALFDQNIKGKPLNRVPTWVDRKREGLRGYINLIRNADTIIRKIDGWADRGAMVRYFKQVIDEAGITAQRMREKASDDLDALYSVYAPDERRRMGVRQKWDGYSEAISKWDIISIALNMGNKDNLERLTSRDSRGSFSRQEVDALVDNLDKRDWDFVQSVWDYLDNEFWPQLKAREERVTGVAPEKVQAQPVETKFGEYRGGYYPIVYDPRYSATARDDVNSDLAAKLMSGRFGKAQTKNGHTKERASGGGGRTVQLGMQVLFGHVNSVIHDLAFGEAVTDVWSLLQDNQIKGLFEEYGMLSDHTALEQWVTDVAAGPAAGTHVLAATARHLKSGFTLSKLAFNLSTVAIQVTGLTQSMAQIGSRNMMKGVGTYLFSARGRFALAQDIKERSPFMAERETTFNRDIYDLLRDAQTDDPTSGVMARAQNVLVRLGFWLMQKVQYYAVDVPTWLGAHHKGLGEGMTESEAAAFADRMVARAQASGLYADRTAVERGTLGQTSRQNEFIRLFTALGSYMFAKFNVTEEVIGRAVRDVRDENKSSSLAVLKGVMDLTLLYVVEMILYHLVRGSLPGMDDEEDRGWAAFIASETALSVASVFPFIRDISGSVQGFDGGGSYGGINDTFGRSIASLVTAFDDDGISASDWRGFNDLGGLLAPGYPSVAVWRVIEGIGATGEDPSPMAVIFGR